jgi:predicted nucleic acid-binding protein
MRLVDVNVLVYAHRLDVPRHQDYAGWLHDLLAGQEPYGISDLVPDAYLAALAIESGSEWITTDRDFSRFPGLRWRHPLKE